MRIKTILDTIFARIAVKHKWQQDFLLELFELVYSIQGRLTFENMARYSRYNESTFRRNFRKFFDWLGLNEALMHWGGLDFINPVIAAIDCSYLLKSGKATYGLDKFYSSLAGKAKKGLEITLLSLIDTASGTAWALDVQQTPSGLSAQQGDQDSYTRIDFYLAQLLKLKKQLAKVCYIVADGYYAKTKVFSTLELMGKHLITRFRPDANLRYLYAGPPSGKRGKPRQFAGKVNWKTLDLSRWDYIGIDHKYAYLKLYTAVLNSPHFKRNFRVVLLINTKTTKYVVLACSNTALSARLIVKYYQLRFQIEFLFRDAKQFCGLTHCQARSKQALHFHFNMSLAAVNLLKLQRKLDPTITSMNSFVRKAYNTRLASWIFAKLSLTPELDINQPNIQNLLEFGCLKA